MEYDYDIVVICETWLTKNFLSEEFFPSNYVVYRADRFKNNTNAKGGGVLIAVRSCLSSEVIACPDSLELLAVRVGVSKHFSIVVCVLYIPSNSTAEVYLDVIKYIDTVLSKCVSDSDHYITFGDFNMPEVVWNVVDDTMIPTARDETYSLVLDFFASLGTSQINHVRNRNNALLDLVFSSNHHHTTVSECDDLTGHSSIHHTPINVQILHESCDLIFDDINNFVFNFRQANFHSLGLFLDGFDWNSVFGKRTLPEMICSFDQIIWTGIEKHVPLKKKKKILREPWYNEELIRVEKKRNKAHALYKSIRTDESYDAFRRLRKEFGILNKFLYNSYVLQIEADLLTDPKKFWSFIDKKKKVVGYPSLMYLDQESAGSSAEISNLFAKFFSQVYCPSGHRNVNRLNGEFMYLNFTHNDVFKAIMELDSSKGAGPDGIPPLLLKECADSLAAPLSFLFNVSLRKGIFPDSWKLSFIQPIFKSGKRSDIKNYRGVAILSAIPKLFECMVKNFMFFHVKTLITDFQHGFYPGRSTVTNLLMFNNFLVKNVESRLQIDVIYTDFSKAFDRIDHGILFEKLDKLNCELIPVEWIKSYLTGRSQYVKIGESTSNSFDVTSGVPQGSHLGPLLFLLFINDVVFLFKFCKCILYADDMKIYAPITCDNDCDKFQEDLDRFCDWTISNKLLLNVDKCKLMSFYKIRNPITHSYSLYEKSVVRVTFMLDLGVIFSTDLTFNKHIDSIISRANTILGFIKRNSKDFYDPLTLKSLYVAFVRSILEYASQVWSPFYASHSSRLESVQKQFLIYALRRLPSNSTQTFILQPYKDRCNLLKLETLESRRSMASALLVNDILCGKIDCAELLQLFKIYAPERIIRRRIDFLYANSSATNYAFSEPVQRSARCFNLFFGIFDFNLSRNTLKNEMRHFLR